MHLLSNTKKKYDYYLVKFEFQLVFNDNEFCLYVTSKISANKTMISCSKFLERLISDFKDKVYDFNHIAELNIITIANKMDTSYDCYVKHNMRAAEWKLIALINKDKKLINKLNRNWRHPLNRKFESYCVCLY